MVTEVAAPDGDAMPEETNPFQAVVGARDPRAAMLKDDASLRDRFYKKEEPIQPMPPIAGPNSIAPKLMPPKQVVRNMNRLRHDEMASWNGIAALRNLVDDTMPEDQQAVVDAGAAQAILATMQAWPDHAGIQVAGCGTLVKVAEVDAAAREIVLSAAISSSQRAAAGSHLRLLSRVSA